VKTLSARILGSIFLTVILTLGASGCSRQSVIGSTAAPNRSFDNAYRVAMDWCAKARAQGLQTHAEGTYFTFAHDRRITASQTFWSQKGRQFLSAKVEKTEPAQLCLKQLQSEAKAMAPR
jgi:hypothetical protein